MKKVFSLFTMAFISMFALVLGVSAAELSSYTEVDGKITLTDDAVVTTSYTVDPAVEVIDLNGKTLTLKKGLVVNSSLEIKNGIILRDDTFTSGTMLSVSGVNTEFKLNGVVVDGNRDKVAVTSGPVGIALAVTSGKSVILENSSIINHKFDYSGIGYIVNIKNTETVEMINSKVSNNYAKYKGIFGVNTCGNFTFDKDSVVSNNIAEEASGIHVQDTDAIIAGTIEGNETKGENGEGNGAGLYVFLSDLKNSSAELKTVTIAETAKIINNTSSCAGGGVYITGPHADMQTGQVVMMGGLISGNTAKGEPNAATLKDGGGAGIYVNRGNMIIEGGTIEGNTATHGIGDAILVSNAGKNSQSGNLEITGGTVDGKIVRSESYGSIAVLGGAFTDDVTKYVVIGVTKTEVDGVTYVGYPIEIELEKTENGKVTLSHNEAIPGQPVKVTVEPDKGYKLSKLVYINGNGEEFEIKDGKFIMLNDELKVKATFVADVKTPDTGDNAMIFMVLGLIGLVGAAVTTTKLRHN